MPDSLRSSELRGEAHAKTIGLDFVFERPTEPNKDAALISAIRSSPISVVLGAIDPRAPLATRHSLDYQNDFFANVGVTRSGRVRAGHVILSRHPDLLTVGDQIVRFVSPPLNSKPIIESFARVLAEVDGPKPRCAPSISIGFCLHRTPRIPLPPS